MLVRTILRDATWLTPGRGRAWCQILLVSYALLLLFTFGWIAVSHGGILDPFGKALGTDFLSFYAASDLALRGLPVEVYDLAAHRAVQEHVAGSDIGYAAFFYPPTFLLVVLPLAALPYFWALAAWLGVTGFAYWRALRTLMPQAWSAPAILAFPAVFQTVGHGQNAFLSAALFGFMAVTLDRRPIVAGICIGSLCYKPHLALLAPFALAAAGRWRAFAAATVTVIIFVFVSMAVFGADTWWTFITQVPFSRTVLELGGVGHEKMQSLFAAACLLGGSVALGYAVQGLAAVAAAVAVVVLARRGADGVALGAVLAAGSMLATPFLLDYDLLVLAIPLAYSANEADRSGGFLPWEKATLSAAFILPLVSRSVASLTGVPLGPVVMAALFAIVFRRAWLKTHSQEGSGKVVFQAPQAHETRGASK